jgi:CHAD domain-containing protein
MPYQFANGEAEHVALQRCAREQLDLAIEQLEQGVRNDPVKGVHEARKALKKVRSLLRLGRGALSSSERRRANAALRSAGQKLSPARDAEVMIQAVDDLSEHYAGQLPKTTWTAIKKHLEAEAAGARGGLEESLIEQVVSELKSVRTEVEQWHRRRSGWTAIGAGLMRGYTDGRHAYRQARRKPTVENLHEWRKRGKDLWYHLRLLQPVSPGIMRGQGKEAHRLSDVLGDDHDLAVLRAALVTRAAAIPADLDSVLILIDHRREQLQSEAWVLGARLYAERDKAFLRRIRSYWKVWHAEGAAESAPAPVQLPGRRRRAAASPA